jgi:hypothetical protein
MEAGVVTKTARLAHHVPAHLVPLLHFTVLLEATIMSAPLSFACPNESATITGVPRVKRCFITFFTV